MASPGSPCPPRRAVPPIMRHLVAGLALLGMAMLRALPWGCLSIAVGLGTLANAEAQQPLRIGASFSNTGSYAQLGQTVHRGQQLCVKHTNEKGGVLGRRIEFTAEDDQSDTARMVACRPERPGSRGALPASRRLVSSRDHPGGTPDAPGTTRQKYRRHGPMPT
jgi:hypothetical protein